LPNIGISEIIIILVVVLAVVFFAKLRQRPRPSQKTDRSDPPAGEAPASGSVRRWVITVALLVLAGLLGYYFIFVSPQP
jgi:hypothetical protein